MKIDELDFENKYVTCIDYPCKYSSYYFGSEGDDSWCTKLDCAIPDNVDEVGCEHFELARTCLDCKHSAPRVYETGTIDDIEYRCTLQNNKMIYDDSNPGVDHYGDIPECNIGMFGLLE